MKRKKPIGIPIYGKLSKKDHDAFFRKIKPGSRFYDLTKIKKLKKSLALYDATELRPEKEGVYKPFVKQNFPVPDKPFPLLLKITVIRWISCLSP